MLLDAFPLQSPQLIALTGGGGKTSLLFALADALPGRVVTTTTTRIFAAQMKRSPAVLEYTNKATLQAQLPDYLARYGQCLLVGTVSGDKAQGVSPDVAGWLLAQDLADFVLVEADGSRMRPIKAPAEHEPVIPTAATMVVPVVGIDAVNGRLADRAHRPERMMSLLGITDENHQLQPAEIAALITHPQGGLKGVPPTARVIPFINKVETAAQLQAARHIAHHILRTSAAIRRVVIGALHSQPPVREVRTPVTAVVLAAGQGQRMGRTKQLLPWGDTTVLGQTIRQAQQSRVHDVRVVTGHAAEQVAAIAAAANVRTIHNPDYAAGEMLSSLQTAVRQINSAFSIQRSSFLVVLADQPLIQPETINQLLFAFWQGKGEIIAPVYNGRRGNPVLISSRFYGELLALPTGAAPRDLLRQYPDELHLVPVKDEAVVEDLDTTADYERLRPQE